MNKKKILIVSRTFYPANSPRSFRTTELAKEFAAKGHDVTIITPRNAQEHDQFEQKYNVKIKDLGQPKWKQVAVAKAGVARLATRIWARFSNLLFLYPDIEVMFLVKHALKKETGQYDLMITIAAPHTVHWGTAMALSGQSKFAKTWVADCGDPFMGGENDTFKRLFYFKYFEKWFCRKADYLTVPIEDAIDAYYPEFRHKIKVIPQGFNFDEVEIVEKLAENQVPTFAYAGSLIPGIRDPHEFFEFLCKTDLEYRFLIYSKNADYARKYAKRSKGRIEVKETLPRLQLLKDLQQMDFVVNFENKGAKQSPSKLIDYAIIQKPILSVKTFGFDSQNLLDFMKGDYASQLLIADVDQYRIQNVGDKFIKLA